MAFIDSIKQAQQKGAQPADILNEIMKQNPQIEKSVGSAYDSGANPEDILNEIVKQNTGKSMSDISPASAPDAQPQDQGGGILSTIGGGIKDFVVGGLKSAGQTIVGTAQLGQKIGHAIGIKGPGQDLPLQTPEFLKPQGTMQEIGNVAGDVAQFLIPGAAEEKAVTSLDKLVDVGKFAERFGPEAGKALEGILKIGSKGLVTGASTAAVTAAQTGGDVGQIKTAAELGFGAGALGKALEMFGPGLSKSIVKSGFKLTPSQQAKLAPKIESASGFIADNKIVGSESTKFRKLSQINQQLEDALQSSVGNDIKVSKNDLIKEIQNAPEQFKTENPAIYQEAKNDAARAVKTLQETKGNQIGLNDLLSGKRSYGQSAFGKGTAQVKGAVVNSEGDYAIEQAYQKTLENGLSASGKSIQIPTSLQKFFGGKTEASLSDFNKVYSNAINAKKFTNAAQFKKDTGLVGRLFGLWAGEAVGQTIAPGLGGKIVGGAIGEIASSRVPGMVRAGAERVLSGGETTIPTATKVGLGLTTSPPDQNP